MTEISSNASPLPCKSDISKPYHLSLPTIVMKRGPRFGEYSALRDNRLRMKTTQLPRLQIEEAQQKAIHRSILTPPNKQLNSKLLCTPPSRRSTPKCASPLTQSVPNFSSALRKENRKPVPMFLPSVSEKFLTPPLGPSAKALYGKKMGLGSSSKSAVKSLMTRKSCTTMEEFKGLSAAAARAINGERRSVTGYHYNSKKQYY